MISGTYNCIYTLIKCLKRFNCHCTQNILIVSNRIVIIYLWWQSSKLEGFPDITLIFGSFYRLFIRLKMELQNINISFGQKKNPKQVEFKIYFKHNSPRGMNKRGLVQMNILHMQQKRDMIAFCKGHHDLWKIISPSSEHCILQREITRFRQQEQRLRKIIAVL